MNATLTEELETLRTLGVGSADEFWSYHTIESSDDEDSADARVGPRGGDGDEPTSPASGGSRGGRGRGRGAGARYAPMRYQNSLRMCLWPRGHGLHGDASRFRRLLRTLMDASAFAFVGATDVLNAHLRANGRMLFELNVENLARLLRSFFRGVRDPDDVLFRGVPERGFEYVASRAKVPSWVDMTLVERQFAKTWRKKIVRSNARNANDAFHAAVRWHFRAIGHRGPPTACEIWHEAVERRLAAQPNGVRLAPAPAWSVRPDASLAPMLLRLYALHSRLTTGSLEDRVASIACINAEAEEHVHADVKQAFERADTLLNRARRLGGELDAIHLSEAAAAQAYRLWLTERAECGAVAPFPNPPFAAPLLKLDCEVMRSILVALRVVVPSLEECRANPLGLFQCVFQMAQLTPLLGASHRSRFGGFVMTDGKTVFVDIAFEDDDAGAGGAPQRRVTRASSEAARPA